MVDSIWISPDHKFKEYQTMTDLFPTSNHISGTVSRVTFQSPESGFCVLQVQVEGRAALVTVVGTAPEINAGQVRIRLTG